MPIIAYYPGDVQSYLALERWQPPRPKACPRCGAQALLVGHGSYPRYVAEEPWLRLRIPRLRCKGCGHTFGVLPSFLVPHRHYSACLIQSTLALRHQQGLSHRQLQAHLKGLPALATCLAWIRSFTTTAHLWLFALLTALACFDPGHDPLDGLSPLGQAYGSPRLLLELLPRFLVALDIPRTELATGLAQGLGLLLLWGQGRSLPRLL